MSARNLIPRSIRLKALTQSPLAARLITTNYLTSPNNPSYITRPLSTTLRPILPSSIASKLPDPENPERSRRLFREFDLSSKTFIVTGGGRGLGLTLAEALVEAGGKVYCLDRLPQPADEFHSVSTSVARGTGGSLSYEQVDVRSAEELDAVIGRIGDENGGLHGLIAAAGVQNVVPALEYPVEAIAEMMSINFTGVYLAAVSTARAMIKHRTPGSILLIASISGFNANKGFTSSVYNSSKAAVCQLTRSLAMEWGQVIDGKPIRVNALCPGNIMTPMVEKNFADDPKLRKTWEEANMLGRISRPEEYRGAALFVLSEASSFMTGSNLIIDGGYTAW